MDLLFSAPYIVRIVASLLAILAFQKLLGRLDAGMLMGMIVLALWTGQSASSMQDIIAARILSLDTLFLVLVIAGVICLSSLMSQSGVMKDLVVSLKSRLPKRAILATLPAVVGLLPMPAGALFSCPLIDDADADNELTSNQKTEINYWFRHVWEFWWPLYPGMLLAVDISGVPIWKFVLLMLPLFFAAVLAGHVFLLRDTPQTAPSRGAAGDKPFLPLIAPILTVIIVYGLLLAAAPGLARFDRYLPMAFGVAAGLAVMQLQRPADARSWMKTILSPRLYGLLLIVVLARAYGAFIEARLPDGTPLMEMVRGELNQYNLPAILLIVLIPFLSGVTTGITIGYIGASFPVVLSLAAPGTNGLFSAIVIGYVCGFIGMMLSPSHICLIVTTEYFKTGVAGRIYSLARPAALLFACAALYAGLWRWAL
jgi:integral membrane protein (TIGR00529 family)